MAQNSLLSELVNDPKCECYLPPEPWAVPELNYDLFKDYSKEDIKQSIDCFIQFLGYHYFALKPAMTHEEIDAWEQGKRGLYGEAFDDFWNANCLRGNGSIAAIKYALAAHFYGESSKYIGNNKAEFEQLAKDIAVSCNCGWKTAKSTSEKIARAYALKEKIHSLLMMLAKK